MTLICGFYRKVLLISWMVIMVGCEKYGLSDATVLYVPLGYSTYLPVTPASIEQKKYDSVRLPSRDLERLLATLRDRRAGTFDPMITRVKVSIPGRATILIDNEGGMKDESGEYRLSHAAMLGVKAIIERLTSRTYPVSHWPE